MDKDTVLYSIAAAGFAFTAALIFLPKAEPIVTTREMTKEEYEKRFEREQNLASQRTKSYDGRSCWDRMANKQVNKLAPEDIHCAVRIAIDVSQKPNPSNEELGTCVAMTAAAAANWHRLPASYQGPALDSVRTLGAACLQVVVMRGG